MANAERPDPSSEVSGRDVGEPFPAYAQARYSDVSYYFNPRAVEQKQKCLGRPAETYAAWFLTWPSFPEGL